MVVSTPRELFIGDPMPYLPFGSPPHRTYRPVSRFLHPSLDTLQPHSPARYFRQPTLGRHLSRPPHQRPRLVRRRGTQSQDVEPLLDIVRVPYDETWAVRYAGPDGGREEEGKVAGVDLSASV